MALKVRKKNVKWKSSDQVMAGNKRLSPIQTLDVFRETQ